MQQINYQTVLLALTTGVLIGERATPRRGKRDRRGRSELPGNPAIADQNAFSGPPPSAGPHLSFHPIAKGPPTNDHFFD